MNMMLRCFAHLFLIASFTWMLNAQDDSCKRPPSNQPDGGEGEGGSSGQQSLDPNEMAGPLGSGIERYVKPGDWMNYVIYFENMGTADVPAQEVRVNAVLSEYLDWSTFELGEVVFNNQTELGLLGINTGTITVPQRDTQHHVKITFDLNPTTGEIEWYLRSYDLTRAAYSFWPSGINDGFLPPNNETHRGEGHLAYRIKIREDAPANVVICASAEIIFDHNEMIPTDPSWWNTVKARPPTAEFVASSVSVEEGASAVLDVTGGCETSGCSVAYWIVPGTAGAKDYTAPKSLPQRLSWEEGDLTPKQITIPILLDKLVEDEEFFTVVLGDAQGMELGENLTCRVWIKDLNTQQTLASAVENSTLKITSSGKGTWSPATVERNAESIPTAVGFGNGVGQSAAMKTSVSATGAGTLYFSVCVTGQVDEVEHQTFVTLWDGKAVLQAWTNLTDWTDVEIPLLKGTHSLSWEVTQGSDPEARAYISDVRFIPDGVAAYALKASASDAQGGDVFGSGVYGAGTKIALSAKARPGWTFSGWEGYPFAKPVTASQTVVMTNDITVTANFTRTVYVQGLALQPQGGKVTGSGYIQSGKSITLTATASKGWLFVGWSDGETAPKRVIPESDARDEAANGLAEYRAIFRCVLPVILTSGTFNGMAGVPMSIPIEIESEYPATLTAKLPKGLKVSGHSIIGAPTAAGDTAVVLTASSSAGKVTQTIRVVVAPMTAGAVGAFTGYLTHTDTPDIIEGTFTLTISASGSISAKVISSLGTLTFTGASWTEAEEGVFTANLTAKTGQRLQLSIDSVLPWNSLQVGGMLNDEYHVIGQRNPFGKTMPAEVSTALAGYKFYYTFGAAAESTLDTGGAENAPEGHSYFSVTVDAVGGFKTAGKLADGTALSGSGTLLLTEEGAVLPCFYQLYKNAGFVSGLLKSADGMTFEMSPWHWFYPGKTPTGKTIATEDRFALTLQPKGGIYSTPAELAEYYFRADNPMAGDYTYLPDVPLTTDAKGNIILPTGKAPVLDKISGEYLYNEANPTVASFTLTKPTGLFSGKFSLYTEEEDAKGVLKLKSTSVSHQGILTPALEGLNLPIAWGFYLLPDVWLSDDEKPVQYKFNRSFGVVIEGDASAEP